MSKKLSLEELSIGSVMETAFWANPVEESGFRFRATHLDGRRAPKVVLCDDTRIRPGVAALVKVVQIKRPERDDRGAIIVELIRHQDFKLEGVYVDPVVAKKLQVLLESGLNILLDGPQGCGKTVLTRTIAENLGYEFVFFNCGAVVEPSDFLATLHLRADEHGAPVTDFVKTEVLSCLEQAGEDHAKRYLVFLDEFNRCPEPARNALMPALDSTRRLYHPIRSAFMAIPDNVLFVAAVNRVQQFSGTFGIDAAQLDRFAPLQVTYPPTEQEVQLLAKRHPELSKGLIEDVVHIAHAIRTSPELRASLSVRATDEACIYLKHPVFESEQRRALRDILKSSYCGRFAGHWDDPSTDAGMVWVLVEKTVAELERDR